MFISSLIPVELYSTASDIGHNPCPSSVRYYGPIIQYTKKKNTVLPQEEI